MGLSLKGLVRGVSKVAGNVGAAVKKAAGQVVTIAKPIASVASLIPGPHQLLTTAVSFLPAPRPKPAAPVVQLPAPRPQPVLIAEPVPITPAPRILTRTAPAPAPITAAPRILTRTAPAIAPGSSRTVVRPAVKVLPRASAPRAPTGFLAPRFALLRLQLAARRR